MDDKHGEAEHEETKAFKDQDPMYDSLGLMQTKQQYTGQTKWGRHSNRQPKTQRVVKQGRQPQTCVVGEIIPEGRLGNINWPREVRKNKDSRATGHL